MTYCVAVRNQAGLVFLSDSRTNAGLDQISTFRKMHIFEVPGERVMVLLTAGNLAISQSVASGLRVPKALGDFLVLQAIKETDGYAIAATDDALLERFFGGEDLPGDEEMAAMKEAMKPGMIS